MAEAAEDQDALREIADYEQSPERARAQENALLDDQVKKWREAQGLALNYVGDALQHDKLPGAATPTDQLIQQSQQDLQDYRAATQREVDAKRRQAEAMAPEYQKYIDASQQQRENPIQRPQVPTLPGQPPTLQQQVNPTAAKSLFAVASMMAALSMAGGRGRGMLAMAGMTGAIQGFNEGNFLKYKTGMETYKTAVDTQIQQYNMQVKDYTLQMDQRHQNLEDMFRELALKGRMYGDQAMVAAAESQNLDAVLKHQFEIAKMSSEMQKVVSQNELLPLRKDLLQEQIKLTQARAGAVGGAGAGIDSIFGIPMVDIPLAQPGQKNEDFLSMLPPARAEVVKRVASGDLNIASLGGMGKDASAMRRNYLEAAAIYDPVFRQQKYAEIDKTLKESTPGGRVGSNILAINTLPHHLDDFVQQFAKLDNSQVQRWNATKNKLATEFGDPALNRLKVPLGFIAGETARVVKGGNAAPTEDEIKYWEKTFDTSASPEQTRQVIWQALKGVGGRLREVETANRKILGPDYQALSPEAKALIIRNKPPNEPLPDWLGGGSGAASSTQYPTVVNKQTGERLIYKDGKWQKP